MQSPLPTARGPMGYKALTHHQRPYNRAPIPAAGTHSHFPETPQRTELLPRETRSTQSLPRVPPQETATPGSRARRVPAACRWQGGHAALSPSLTRLAGLDADGLEAGGEDGGIGHVGVQAPLLAAVHQHAHQQQQHQAHGHGDQPHVQRHVLSALGGCTGQGVSTQGCSSVSPFPCPSVCPPAPWHSPGLQSSEVQLRVSSSAPWHSWPPLRGAGSEHSRLRQCVHSVPHTDHLLHSDQAPSTVGTAGVSASPAPPQHPFPCPGAGTDRRTHTRGVGGRDERGGRDAGCGGAQAVPRARRVPGQRVVQALFCTFWPSQKAPPLRGVGLVQVRLRFCQPRPQLVLQPDHCVHVDQPPFTGWRATRQRPPGRGGRRGTGTVTSGWHSGVGGRHGGAVP